MLTSCLLMSLHSVDVPQPHKIRGVKGGVWVRDDKTKGQQ